MDIYIIINSVVSNTENYKLNFVHLTINHFTAVLFFRKTKKSNFQESIYYHLGFMSGIIFKETTYRFYVAIMLIMSLSMILFETWNDT